MEQETMLEYVPFSSSVNPSFWSKLTELKLDVDKLSEKGRKIWGYFSNLNMYPKPIVEVDSTSFNETYNAQNTHLPMYGTIFNKNTIEQFKDCDKTQIIEEEGKKIWDLLENGEALKNPSLLNNFFILSFADLKKYHYYYWFAFPVLANVKVVIEQKESIDSKFDADTQLALIKSFNSLEENHKSYGLINEAEPQKLIKLESKISVGDPKNLEGYKSYYFVFADPCQRETHPGWTLRNYIVFLLYHCPAIHGKSLNFLAFRLSRSGGQLSCKDSLIFKLRMPDFNGNIRGIVSGADGGIWVGWEKNERDKLGPRLANMKNSIDPKCLSEKAVDLNLKLMKWRILPDINLEKIKNVKCLLLGSGTLGCAIARSLLAWGVRNITFVDNSTVSFSNPVRQSLYTYEDSVESKPKAMTAAENLKKIFPGVNSVGYQLNIPMPGHPVGESLLEQTKADMEKLTNLISEHDVIFLLMDSRESRWVPTVLGRYLRKIVINAALGFDTYLIQRHGMLKHQEEKIVVNAETQELPKGYSLIQGDELGCYFCNDITAPGNSLRERPLDQQCTVTRPGVSTIAGALAVELAISILQHKDGPYAPCLYQSGRQVENQEVNMPDQCILGDLPHSIRGFLSSFTHVLPALQRFSQCVACSDFIMDEYGKRGFNFLLDAFNSHAYLEELTGLTEFYKNIPEAIDIDDFEDFNIF